MDWTDSLNHALRYVEECLPDEVDVMEAARRSGFTPFYLQRMFAAMTGLSLSEYARERRLSMAGQTLQGTRAKVIDVALQYGYETPESFQKAFRRFHGVTPSAARNPQTPLRYRNPLHIQINLTGGKLMDYQLENKDAFTVMGQVRKFNYDSAFERIPGFWTEYESTGMNDVVCACLGICLPKTLPGPEFEYMIGNFCDSDAPVPEGFRKVRIDAHCWIRFCARGPIPEALQQLNRRVFTEWLPSNPEYEPACDMNIECYSMGDMSSADYESELWLPVQKKAGK